MSALVIFQFGMIILHNEHMNEALATEIHAHDSCRVLVLCLSLQVILSLEYLTLRILGYLFKVAS